MGPPARRGLAPATLGLLLAARAALVVGTWERQAGECAEAPGRCQDYEPPFREAALWALRLIPEECDAEQGEDCAWNHMPQTWRYVWNNLRLAVASAARDGDQPPEMLEDMEQGLSNVHTFIDQLDDHVGLWFRNWHEGAGAARHLAGTLEPWLDARAGRQLDFLVPVWNHGLRFPAPGRSLQLPERGGPAPSVVLGNGLAMPLLGFGTWELPAEDGVAYRAVRWALEAGYRHVDTSDSFGNDREVGRALRDSGVPRGELFVTARLSDPDAYASGARKAFEAQLGRLGLEYVDAYALQKPGHGREDREAAWRALEALYDEGRVRALGANNFGVELLEELLDFARVRPVYTQSKYSVYQPGATDEGRQSVSLMEWLSRKGIIMVGASTLRRRHGRLLLQPLEDPHVLAISQRLRRSPAQVMRRWVLQLGAAVISSSSQREHIFENLEVFDFSIPEAEMRLLNGIAALVAASPGRRAPVWCEDIYGLARIE